MILEDLRNIDRLLGKLIVPSSCSQGICGTCKTALLEGTVDMNHNGGIRQREIDLVSLGDTTGYANPGQVATTLQAVRVIAGDKLRAAHFHDTRGLALANSLVAVQQGITELDSSLAGLGGCPFAPGASGNTVTEDLVFMLQSMGYDTGVDLPALIDLQLLQIRLDTGQGIGRTALEAFLREVREQLFLFQPRHQHLADAGAVQRRPPADARVHAQVVFGIDRSALEARRHPG